MSRDGFSLTVMGFTGKEARVWKIKFLQAFGLMEREIFRLKGKEWMLNRQEGKLMRRQLTDVIQEYIDYAVSQGSTRYKDYPSTAYTNFTNMEYKVLFGISKVNKDFRDSLSTMDLHCLSAAEISVSNTLAVMMNNEIHYKEIYRVAKDKIEKLKELLMPTNTIGNPFTTMLI